MNRETLIFFRWIYANFENLNLNYYQRKKISTYLPGIVDLVVKSSHPNLNKWYGQGWGLSQPMAIVKAVAEILEREIMNGCRFRNSNGCSVHVDKDRARSNATFELIERDAFFCHYLTSTPFDKFHGDVQIFGMSYDAFRKHLKKHELEFEIFKMRAAVKCEAVVVYLAPLRGKNAGSFQFSTAASFNLAEACEHATIEAMRSFVHYLDEKKILKMSEETFFSENFASLPEIQRHSLLRQNKKYHEYIKNAFFTAGKTKKSIGRPIMKFEDIKTRKYKINIQGFEKIPLHFYRASSKDLQSLYFGESSGRKVNKKRLSSFLGTKIESTPNSRIHFFS